MKRQRYGILKTPAVLFNFLILPALIAAAWYVATATGAMSTLILPRLGTVFQTFIQQITSGVLPGDLAVSLSRIVKGYSGRYFGNSPGSNHGNEYSGKPIFHSDLYGYPPDSHDRLGSDSHYMVWDW